MVYVGTRIYKYGRMKMSHMAADTIEELHKMALMINIAKRHFQNKPGKPHYDICQQKKQQAIQLGAIEVCDKEIIKLFQKSDI